MPHSFRAALLSLILLACRDRSASIRFAGQMQGALAGLAGAEDVYYGANQRYSADPSITTSLTLAPGVGLAIWSADQGGWSASASHDSTGETCFLSGRNNGNGAFAVLDGPTCTDSIFTSAERQARARGPNPAAVPSASPATALEVSVLLPGIGPRAEEFGYPTQTIDRLAVRRLLVTRSFDALDALLSAYDDSVTRDYRFEYHLYDGYGAFHVAMPSLEPALTEWVQQRPNSGAALLARANFLSASGGHARGTKWGRETSSEQFKRMGDFFRLAVADVVAAHRLAPRSIMAYYELMAMANSRADMALSRRLLEEALSLQPNSFLLRMRHMDNLEPRWGGSYEAMARFAEEAAASADRNPRLVALRGFADWDRGRMLSRTNHEGAIEAYGRALRFGNYWQFRYQRGMLYGYVGREAEAYEDLTSALVQRPQDADVLAERAAVEYDLGRSASGAARAAYYTQGFRDIELAVALDPTDEDHRQSLAFFRKHIPQFAPPARQ